MTCDQIDVLLALDDSERSPDVAALFAHAGACARCAERHPELTVLADEAGGLDVWELPGTGPLDRRIRAARRRFAAVGGALVLAAAIGLAELLPSRSNPPAAEAACTSAGQIPAAAPEAVRILPPVPIERRYVGSDLSGGRVIRSVLTERVWRAELPKWLLEETSP